jgi:uncharacterized protein YgbK (DUF1537 family)
VGLVDRLCVARGAVAVRAALNDLRANGVMHVVVDAVADSDLGVIAAACRDDLLMTGGSAVAMPLPQLYQQAGLLTDAATGSHLSNPGGGGLILSGSCSAMTQKQVAAYPGPAFRIDPLELAQSGTLPALDWLAGQSGVPLIYATAPPDRVRAAQHTLGRLQAGAMVESALATIAVAARDRGPRRFVVAGGESSGAVTQALGVSSLDVGLEIAPGVPWCFAQSGGVDIALALKSGNFGDETFFAQALQKLEAI